MIRKLLHFSSHSCPLTHSIFLVLYKSPLKIATKKIQHSTNSMVSGLCSGLITEWGQLESRAGLLSRAAGSRLGLFSRAGGGLICISSCYIASSCGRFRLPESRSDVTILAEILTMPALKKEREYLEGKQWR
jgi:hypothetical protein